MYKSIFLVTCLGLAFSAQADPEEKWPKFGVMDRPAYEAYFTAGVYRTYSPDYGSHGSAAINRMEFVEEDDGIYLYWESNGLAVGPNIIPSVEYQYSKTVTPSSLSKLRWDKNRKRATYTLAKEDVADGLNKKTVWFSSDNDVRISPADVEYGSGNKYYRDALEATDGECCFSEDEFDDVTVGENSINCAFVSHPVWDVQCYHRHLASGFYWTLYYSRLEQGVS